jgi:hypothetical protein
MSDRTRTVLVLLGIVAVLALFVTLLQLTVRNPSPPIASANTVSAVVSVRVDATKPDGTAWDKSSGARVDLPDPAICLIEKGQRHCYPGGAGNVTEPSCADSTYCDIGGLKVPVIDPVHIEVWDEDVTGHELVCEGDCAFGRVCEFHGCSVAIGSIANPLGRPPAAAAGDVANAAGAPRQASSCDATPFDAARLARIARNPGAERQLRERSPVVLKNERMRAWDYEMPGCSLMWLQKSDDTSWAITCHDHCAETSGLGTVDYLVTSELRAADGTSATTIRWYEVVDGPLRGTFVSLASDNGEPGDLSVETAESIRREEFPKIARWICEHRTFPRYEKPCAVYP